MAHETQRHHSPSSSQHARPVRLEDTVSKGSVISWLIMLLGFCVQFGYLQATVNQAKADAKEAKEEAKRVSEGLVLSNSARVAEIGELRTDMAVVKVTMLSMDKKLDQVLKHNQDKE